jgi:hypothetical protein
LSQVGNQTFTCTLQLQQLDTFSTQGKALARKEVAGTPHSDG